MTGEDIAARWRDSGEILGARELFRLLRGQHVMPELLAVAINSLLDKLDAPVYVVEEGMSNDTSTIVLVTRNLFKALRLRDEMRKKHEERYSKSDWYYCTVSKFVPEQETDMIEEPMEWSDLDKVERAHMRALDGDVSADKEGEG